MKPGWSMYLHEDKEELEQLQNRYKELGIKDGICTKDI